MRWATHQAMAVMAAFALHQPLAAIAAAWAGSVLPDILDQRKASASFFRQKTFNREHRKTTHWFGWWLVLALAPFDAVLGPLPGALIRGAGLGALSHVLLDMCTTKGVPLLPFGTRRFSLKLCSTGSLGEYALLAMSIVLFWTVERNELLNFSVSLY